MINKTCNFFHGSSCMNHEFLRWLAMIRMQCHEKAMIMDEKPRTSHDGQPGYK